MAELTVVCARVTGGSPGMTADVVVSDRLDITGLSMKAKSGETVYFDGEFKHLEKWCERRGLRYQEKEVTFTVNFDE